MHTAASVPHSAAPVTARGRGLGRLWALVVLQLPFMFVASTPIVPPDIWWTLRIGRMLLAGEPLDAAPCSRTRPRRRIR